MWINWMEELLWTQLHKRLDEWLLASEEGLCSVQLVRFSSLHRISLQVHVLLPPFYSHVIVGKSKVPINTISILQSSCKNIISISNESRTGKFNCQWPLLSKSLSIQCWWPPSHLTLHYDILSWDGVVKYPKCNQTLRSSLLCAYGDEDEGTRQNSATKSYLCSSRATMRAKLRNSAYRRVRY
jgi:hypothetical protein